MLTAFLWCLDRLMFEPVAAEGEAVDRDENGATAAAAAADRVTARADDYMAGIFVRTAERENWSTASRRFKQNLNKAPKLPGNVCCR